MLFHGLGLALLLLIMTLSASLFGGGCTIIAWNRFKNAELSNPEMETPKGLSALTAAACIGAVGVLNVLLGLGAARGSAAETISGLVYICAPAGSFVFVAAGCFTGIRDRTEPSGIVRNGCIAVSVIDLICIAGIVAISIGILKD